MAVSRHELRYKAMTILYQAYLYESNDIDFDIKDIINEQLEENNDFVNKIVSGVINNNSELNSLANKYLENWTIDRLGLTDQAILKMGIFELLYTDTPDKSCIDEAIELSKEYSDDKVSKMINGVLDKIYHSKDSNE